MKKKQQLFFGILLFVLSAVLTVSVFIDATQRGKNEQVECYLP